MRAERWQLGSDMHLGMAAPQGTSLPPPWAERPHQLFGLGRDALDALARDGSTLWAPTYFCHDVLRWLQERGRRVRLYPDAWADAPRDLELPGVVAGDVVLAVSYFGLRAPPRPVGLAEGTILVEDHTHDPWSGWARGSRADFVLASLRKSSPIPDGAVLWSPRGLRTPEAPAPDPERTRGALLRLTGMALKAQHLAGGPVSRAAYREPFLEGEAALERGGPGAASAYAATVVALASAGDRERRRDGLRAWARMLSGAPGLELPFAEPCADAAPFTLVVRLGSRAARDRVRSALIAKDVFPAVLWSLDRPIADVPAAHRDLADRSLFLPVDARYDDADLERAAAILREVAA